MLVFNYIKSKHFYRNWKDRAVRQSWNFWWPTTKSVEMRSKLMRIWNWRWSGWWRPAIWSNLRERVPPVDSVLGKRRRRALKASPSNAKRRRKPERRRKVSFLPFYLSFSWFFKCGIRFEHKLHVLNFSHNSRSSFK